MPKVFTSCVVEREVVVTHSTLDLFNGKRTIRATTTEIQPCGVPLFGDLERQTGICQSCAKGWSVDGNRPTPKGLKTIAEAKS
jgi:hypothetical protein